MPVGFLRTSVHRYVSVGCALGALALYSPGAPAQSGPPLVYGVTDLGAPGGGAAAAHDVSEFAYVSVGRMRTATGAYHAFAQGYSGFRDLGTLGGSESIAFAATTNVVVGQAQTASGEERAFLVNLRSTAGMTNLGTLGGSWSAAYDTLDEIVVGASRTAGNAQLQAFEYRNGAMAPVPVNWGGDSVAKGVNSAHDIVGYACTAANASCRAFLSSGGVVTDLGSLGGNSVANGLNEHGQIVGSSVVAGTTQQAFLYADGTMRGLGTLGGANSEGLGISHGGDIVGSSQDGSGATRAFLWRDGVMTDLNTLLPAGSGWVLQSAAAISEGGQIAGTGTFDGTTRGFLLTPPTDLDLMTGGVRTQSDSNRPRGVEVGRTVSFVTSVLALSDQGITVYGTQTRHTLTGPAEFIAAGGDDLDTCDVTPAVVTCRFLAVDTPGTGREVWLRARTTGSGEITHHAVVTSDVPDPDNSNDTITEDNRAVALSTFVLTPSSIFGGKASSARVTLTDRAPGNDAIVRLTSSRPDIAPVPPTFAVPTWTNTRALNIIPVVVSAPTPVDITATYGLVTVTTGLTVLPPVLTQLYLTPTTVIGGCGTSAGKVVLSGSAPAAGGVVPLSTTNAKALAPASVTVAAGTSVRTFTIPTSAVTTPATGTVTASYGGASQTLKFTVRPIRAKTVTFAPNPAAGGSTVTGTVTLECGAAPGAVVINLTSSNPGVAVPAVSSITIPAGGTTGSFSVRTTRVAANTTVSIHAWVFGVRKTATLTVRP